MSAQSQFGKLYQNVLKDRRLDHVDIRILGFLLSFAPGWRFIQAFVATELGLSLSSVARSVCRLDAAGYLTYDTKVRKSGSVRKNIRVQHQPSHWNPIEDAQPPAEVRANSTSKKKQSSVSQAIADVSSLNEVHVRDDIQTVSQMTYNEETTKSSIVDLGTESYDVEALMSQLLPEDLSLWSRFNTPPNGYVQIELNEEVAPVADLVVKLYEEALSVLRGLTLKSGEVDKGHLDLEYYRQEAIQACEIRSKFVLNARAYFVQVEKDGARLYLRPGSNQPFEPL